MDDTTRFVGAVETTLGYLVEGIQIIDSTGAVSVSAPSVSATPLGKAGGYVVSYAIPLSLLDGTAKSLGISLAAKQLLRGVSLEVTTAETVAATPTLNVGILGDTNGFLQNAPVGVIGCVTDEVGASGRTRGDLLVKDIGAGQLAPRNYCINAATPVYVQSSGAFGNASIRVILHLESLV